MVKTCDAAGPPRRLFAVCGIAYDSPGGEDDGGRRILLADRSETRVRPTTRDDHIRRAVLCWNACADLTDDELERLASGQSTLLRVPAGS